MPEKWTHPKPLYRHEETIELGDRFEATDAELAAFGDRITSVAESDASSSTPASPFDPSEHTIKELRTKVDDLSDSQREALVEAEQDGKDRETAIQVLSP